MSFQIGETVGDYQVTGVLGRGGMGRVFRVRHTISQREEAMKIVLPDFEARPDVAERFLREIRVHASLTHPNIAALHTAFRVGAQLLMVMELVDGVSVEDMLRQGPIELHRAISYADQVLAALSYAHERGVIHRDIKPANIMVTGESTVKLMDFGIARAEGQRELTGTGVAVGSLYYMSPEQISGLAVDARSDLYATGITLYEMATGRRPIQGGSEYSIMQAHLHQAPAPPSALSPEIPPGISNAIVKSLAKDASARYQTADEFRRALAGTVATTTMQAPVVAGLSAETLNFARQKLAVYIGPIAKVLVERTARRVQGEAQFYQALAEHVPDESRRAFLASVKR
jgi:eukaryotic-like serine/threonine-protein kinase